MTKKMPNSAKRKRIARAIMLFTEVTDLDGILQASTYNQPSLDSPNTLSSQSLRCRALCTRRQALCRLLVLRLSLCGRAAWEVRVEQSLLIVFESPALYLQKNPAVFLRYHRTFTIDFHKYVCESTKRFTLARKRLDGGEISRNNAFFSLNEISESVCERRKDVRAQVCLDGRAIAAKSASRNLSGGQSNVVRTGNSCTT